MELVQASMRDLEQATELYHSVAEIMRNQGLNLQGMYTGKEQLQADIENGKLYIRLFNGRLAAGVIVETEGSGDEDRVNWSCGVRYAYFSRMAVHPSLQGHGIGEGLVDDVIQLLRSQDYDSVRCELSEDNSRVGRVLEEKMGFRRCGVRQPEGEPCGLICYDKPLKRETRLLPIRMNPAFRSGKLTPWGGDRLQALYGKKLREIPTGESLEVSCIPGLESRDELGRTLPDLIREYGRKLIGKYYCRPFPLLLKLIDARESLSVQVHPDNEYAMRHENGKLGKTEAWLILDTPKGGGELVYGIVPGTSPKQLRAACEEGAAVEPLLRRVKVMPGDVCYIPAGCVHAIGAGIMLYEIQESSDITYRFYDWDRTDASGNRRELHLEQALAVSDLRMSPQPIQAERSAGMKRVLDEEFFTLDIIRDSAPVPQVKDFGFLTILEGRMTLSWPGGSMRMEKGETCFLPALLPEDLRLDGVGAAALSMPT